MRRRNTSDLQYSALRPGAWIEVHEVVPFVKWEEGSEDHGDHPMDAVYRLLEQPPFTELFGWNLRFPEKIVENLKEIGFVDVREKHTMVPIGRWHTEPRMREMGMFCQNLCEDWIRALLDRHSSLGLSEEEANEMGQRVFDSFNDPRIHVRLDWIDCCAQKPWS